MKKKLFLIVSLCMLVLGLTACGEDPKKVDYNGVSYEQLEGASQNLVSTLVALSDDDIDNYIAQSMDDITTNLIQKWKEMKPEVGDYIDLGEFSVDKSGKTLTTTQIMDFSGRDLTLTCVYNYLNMQISDITLDENYSLGEKMQKAAMNTLMGLGTVFVILVLISLIIKCFEIIPRLQKQAEEKKAAAAGTVQAEAPAAPQPEPVVEAAPAEDDTELIAVIAAAVAAASGTAPDGFEVRSIIRRRKK